MKARKSIRFLSVVAVATMGLLFMGCSSTPKKPDVEIKKKTEEERVIEEKPVIE